METPWAVILCKFTDDDSEPFPKQKYLDLFTGDGSASWNMVRYFRDYSHGKLDLSGTQVFGWYQLDRSVDDYNALLGMARPALIQWARDAATANGVDLSPFYSTVVCTNLWQDIGAWTASEPKGAISQGPTTLRQQLLAHEMGHVYGLEHSRIDGSNADYMDPWDIMSAATVFSAPDPDFTIRGPGVNAWNMRFRGWLDESRVWKPAPDNFDETVVLRPHVERDLKGWLAAELPGGYLAEFRLKEGWDGAIPRPAVLIHRMEGVNSYLMRGNSGFSDLVAGDSFGDAESEAANPFSGFDRVEVIAIDPAGKTATLRIRHRRRMYLDARAVDPMSLILPGGAYLIWLELKHPHTPKAADLEAVVRAMTPQEQRAALARAQALREYGTAVEEAIQRYGGDDGAAPARRTSSRG